MTAGASAVTEPRPQTRPVRSAAYEIVVMVVALLLVMGLAVIRVPGGAGPVTFASWAGRAGEVLLTHIGATFGVYVPTLLGFYALVVGQQIVDAPRFAARTRRVLGRVAEVMAACLVPALVLIVAACLRRPELAGAMFAVVPMTALVFFLALQLGSFVIIEDELRRENAQESLEWASARRAGLRGTSAKKWPWIVAGNCFVLGLVGLLASIVVKGTVPESWFGGLLVTLLSAGLGPGIIVIFIISKYLGLITEGATGRLLSSSLPILLWTIATVQIVTELAGWRTDSPATTGNAVLAAVTLAASLSAYCPLGKVPVALGDWTVASVAQGMAAAELDRVKAQSEAILRELEPVVAPVEAEAESVEERTPRARRIRNALQALRS